MKLFNVLVISLFFTSTSTFSLESMNHSSRLIVKIKAKSVLEHRLITNYKKLFSNVYSIISKNPKRLEAELLKSSKGNLGIAEKDSSVEKALWWPKKAIFNDRYLKKQWALKDSKAGMNVFSALSDTSGVEKEKIIVAVVDTGLDVNHKDIPVWINKNEIPGNGIDDDKNGYIDDINGINTLVRDRDGNATVDIKDTHGHGTHVSGSIGASQDNGLGIAGVASTVEIMGIRTVPNTSDELDVDIIEAFIYAAENGAKIINCSFGKKKNEGGQAVSEAIEFIKNKYGVLVIAAAGNENSNVDKKKKYPASFENDNLLVVASSTKWGKKSGFSNFGLKSVDLAAPGSSIYSTVPKNKYRSMSGTSMASPNVAGVAAEVLSQFPKLSPIELKEILMKSVTPVKAFEGKMVSPGIVDLKASLELAESLF